MKKIILIIIVLLISFLISCNNGMGSGSADSAADESASSALVTDSSKGVVFIDEDGSETVVKNEEDGEEIVCREVIDYVLVDQSKEPLSKSSVKTIGRKRAIVLGYRSDGCPGLWIVYSGGIVRPVVNSEDIETSELLEFAEARQPFFKHFGWSYKAVDMAVNGNEIIIAGYAENEEGIPWWGIDPGTTVGVYWPVFEDDEGYYHISRARVVGYRDHTWWKNLMKEMRKSSYRYRWRWLRSLRLFFFGWYDRYLTMTESVEVGENPGEYLIKGIDDEGDAAEATVTRWKVLAIEKAPDEPSDDIFKVTGPLTASAAQGTYAPQEIYLQTDAPGGGADPSIVFKSTLLPDYISLDPDEGILTVINAEWKGVPYNVIITVWTEDDEGNTSPVFTITLTLTTG